MVEKQVRQTTCD